MTLQIGAAVQNGFNRVTKRNGLVLFGVFVLLGLVNTVVSQSLLSVYFDSVAGQFPQDSGGFGTGFPPATPLSVLPVWLAAAIWFVMIFVYEAARIVGVRTFVSDETDTIPSEFRTRNLPMAVLNGVLAGIIAAILVGIGSVFLLVPGIFLALSFFFFRQEIAVGDKNFIDALTDSWSIASGNRFTLLLLGLAILVIGLIAMIPGFVLGLVLPNGSVLAALVNVVTSGFMTVLGMAIAARAYVQLTGVGGSTTGADDTGGAAGTGGTADDDTATGETAAGIPLAGGDGREGDADGYDGDDGDDDDDDEWNDPPGVDV